MYYKAVNESGRRIDPRIENSSIGERFGPPIATIALFGAHGVGVEITKILIGEEINGWQREIEFDATVDKACWIQLITKCTCIVASNIA